MRVTKLLYGLAALPLVAGVASAEPAKQATTTAKKPMQLTEQQMDKVTAGVQFFDFELGNSYVVWASTWSTAPTAINDFFGANNAITCPTSLCYLNISNRGLSVASAMLGGPVGTGD
jgi:hypothetical protein